MAAERELENQTVVHRQGYERFITMFKVGTAIAIVMAVIVILVIRK